MELLLELDEIEQDVAIARRGFIALMNECKYQQLKKRGIQF